MRVKTVHDFFDKQNDLKRVRAGEELEVTQARAQQLITFGVAQMAEPEATGKTKLEKDKKQAAE